jgi:hypothetical protein
VQLLVLPDPDQRLADQCPRIVAHVQLGNPPGHCLLPVGDRDDLLPLQCEEQQPRALRLWAAGKLPAPPVELQSHVFQKYRLELGQNHLQPGFRAICGARLSQWSVGRPASLIWPRHAGPCLALTEI